MLIGHDGKIYHELVCYKTSGDDGGVCKGVEYRLPVEKGLHMET